MRGLPLAPSISAADAEPWEVRRSSHKFFLSPPFPQAPRGYRWEAGPGRGKAGGGNRSRGSEVRGKGECEGDPDIRRSWAVRSGPEGGREGLAGPASPESLGEPPDPSQEMWIHSVQTFRGTNLGRGGNLGKPRVVHAVPEVMPTPAQESDWQNGEAC